MVGFFPTMPDLFGHFPIPTLYTGKTPIPADGIFLSLSYGKKVCIGVSKNITLTTEGIILM
jgi:hypothetical protein